MGVEPTLDNLKNLTDAQAKEIYRHKFWDAISADQINDGDVRYLLFDFYVNSPVGSIKTIQEVLNGLGESLVVDGRFGVKTLNAINKYSSDIRLYNNFKEARYLFYQRKINASVNRYLKKYPSATEKNLKNNTKKRYENGWKNRVDKFNSKTKSSNENVNCN